MDALTLYGLISVLLMLVFYALEARSHWFVLAFSISCLMASAYGFMQGAWPFGLVELIWAGVAATRWRDAKRSSPSERLASRIPLIFNSGVELRPTQQAGIANAIVLDEQRRSDLTWDRYARLSRTADALKQRVQEGARILDVGGFDGALALFLPRYHIDVIDPDSTGGSGLDITCEPYEVVVSIDALEHVAPEMRDLFLGELTRSAREWCFINYPARRTADAQKLVYELTNNALVKEHVEWALPSAEEVTAFLCDRGFVCETIEHTSVSQWVSQYILQSASSNAAALVNSYLQSVPAKEPAGLALYDLVIGSARKSQ